MSQPEDTLRQSLRQQLEEFLETNKGADFSPLLSDHILSRRF